MEKERQEKLKKKLEQEKANADKAKPADSVKVQHHRSLCICMALGHRQELSYLICM